MKDQTTTVEDIERRQRLLSILFKLFIAIIVLIVCLFVAWLISLVGYAAESSGLESVAALSTVGLRKTILPVRV